MNLDVGMCKKFVHAIFRGLNIVSYIKSETYLDCDHMVRANCMNYLYMCSNVGLSPFIGYIIFEAAFLKKKT